MRIHIKDKQGQPRLTVHVDPATPPTVVHATDDRGPAISLDWDQTLDDEGRLRHCPVCGSPDFYTRKKVPQLTVFALIVAAAVIAMVFYGFGLSRPALIVLAVVLAVDLLIYLYAERYFVCYRCASEFHATRMAGNPRTWDANTAERYKDQAHPP
ncbi:MAG: hypothetical protein AAGL98_01780 [Planctomycetota bacterium]